MLRVTAHKAWSLLAGSLFVRGGVGGAAAAGVQDRHELLQLLEGADTQFVVDSLSREAEFISVYCPVVQGKTYMIATVFWNKTA